MGVNMFRRSLFLVALTAVVTAAAATQAGARSCYRCAHTYARPVPIQIWGLSPVYVVNQGPVYTGPGFTTSPIWEEEASTAGFPYVRDSDYPRHGRRD